MSKSIKISPKHGLNPSVTTCFFCGKDTGVALLGRLKGDAEAPHRIVADYEPCDDCKALMAQGITLLEATGTPPAPEMPPVQENVWLTGRFMVVKEPAFRNIIDNPVLADEIIEKGKAFIDHQTFEMLMSQSQHTED